MQKPSKKIFWETPDSERASAPESARTTQTHDHEVTRSTLAVNHPILERRLFPEAQLFECSPRALLVGGHHRSHLLEPEVLTETEDLAHQTLAQPRSPVVNPDLNSHFAHPPSPSRTLCMQTRVADNVAVQFSQYRD